MKKLFPKKISQPSDLFDLEILPEITFNSEYGKLTLGSLIVPDFSFDDKGSVRLNEEFDNLNSFIKEKDLSKKLEIVERIYENEFIKAVPGSRSGAPNRAIRSSKIFSEFIDSLCAIFHAQLFEIGLYSNINICSDFGYDIRAPLSSGIIFYNDAPLIQPYSCSVGLYIYCLRCALNPKNFCVYQDVLDRILANELPRHNYLSWACSQALADKDTIRFLKDVNPCLCFIEN